MTMLLEGKDSGKHVLVRPDVSTGSKHNRYAEAIANSFGPQSERVKSGKHAPAIIADYSKSGGIHDPERGIHATHSDLGPAVHTDEQGKEHLSKENVMRRGTMQKETQHEGKGSYTVFNRLRPGASDKKGGPVHKEYHDTMNKLHTIRRYELHPSEPNEHEKAHAPKGSNPREYHHPEGHGRVTTSEGHSYKYQDHPVADKHKLTTGESVFPGDTDARHMDTSSRKFKTHPDVHGHQHTVGTVTPAFATSGTANDALHSSTMFHDVKDIDSKGIYHDSHPDKVKRAMDNAGIKELPKERHSLMAHVGAQ